MATRKIIDIEQNGEKVWPKGHAKATYMSDGSTVEDAINQIGTGGGGGITVETDPIFSASPAASITEAKKKEWDNKVDNVSGKQLSTQDFTTELEGKLKGIEANAQKNVQSDWNENDRASDAYVNNRTHYSYDIEPVASFSVASKNEGDILVIGLNEGAFYKFYGSKSDTFYFVVGRKVIIPAYGPTIEAVCDYDDDLDGFCLKLTTPTYGLTESFDLMEIHVEQLDDVYIPETIARKAEIATINGQSLTEGGDITIQGNGGAVDNVYITDFKVVDFQLLKAGEIESLQIDSAALSEAIIAKKTILVPYDDGYVGGYSLLLGEVADTEIYFSIYTYFGQYIYVESYDGVVNAHPMIIRNLQTERVQQTSLDTLKNIANANAVQTDGLLYAFPDQATGDEDDVLLSRGTVKTINGKTIMRDGDNDDIITTYERITTNLSSVELLPNTVTEWVAPITFRDLVLTFGEQPSQAYAVEYIAKFNVGADGVQLIVPDGVVWADGVYPDMTNGKTYEISFVDNLATFLEF